MKNVLILFMNIKFFFAQENSFTNFDANNSTTLAIHKDGTLWNICSKEKISNDNDWKSISISGDKSELAILIKNNGSLWGYGYRYFSGLYNGPDKFLYKIDDDNIWKKVIALEKYAIALKDDGSLWYWEYLPLGNIESKVTPIKIGDLKIDDFNMSCSYPPFLTVLSEGKLYGMMLGDGNKINIKDYSFTLLNETKKWKYVVTQNYSPTVLLIAEDNTLWYCKNTYTNDITKIKNEIDKIKKISNENDWKDVSFYNNVILGIKNDGSVYIWSNGEFNGNPSFPSKMNLINLPLQFFKDNKWSSAKVTHNRIVLKDEQGFLFAYGDNTRGQLCDGGTYSFSKNLVKLLITPEININKGEYEYTGIKEEVSDGVIYEQIKKGDKIGYCDENRQVVFEPLFDNAKGHINGWENGYKDVKKNGKQGIINKNGSIVIPFEYDYFWCSFENDKKYFIIGNKNGIQYILDKDNKITYQTPVGISIADIFTADESTHYKVYNKELNKYGVINSSGKQIIPFEYEYITYLKKENKYLKSLFFVYAKQEGVEKKGYIGLDGKVLLPAIYDDVYQIGQGQFKAKEKGNEIVFDNNFKCLKGCQFIPKKPIEKPQIVKAITTSKTNVNTVESKQTAPKQVEDTKQYTTIYEKVEIQEPNIYYADGNGTTFGQFLKSANNHIYKNINAFVLAKLKNKTNKTIKVKATVTYYFKTESTVLFSTSYNLSATYATGYYEISPNSSAQLATLCSYSIETYNQGVVSAKKDLDNEKPYTISLNEYDGEITDQQIKSQNELISKLKANGNVETLPGWGYFKPEEISYANTKTKTEKTSEVTKSSNTKNIEFREIKTNKENCGGYSYRLFDVYKNGRSYKTLKVVSHNDEWWSSCPFDCTLCTKLSKSKYSLKQFLIYCHEGDAGKADNYTITEL